MRSTSGNSKYSVSFTVFDLSPSLTSVVTKYHPGQDGMAAFGDRIHAFLPGTPGIEFGAVIPKGNHLTITVAGAAADAHRMDTFLHLPMVRHVLPCLENAGQFDTGDLSYFKGHFPRGLGRRIAGDRFVVVGDAAYGAPVSPEINAKPLHHRSNRLGWAVSELKLPG